MSANKNAVDAVLSENDGMAGGVIAALTAQGLAGKVPVSGQDGDKAALNRVALGTQTVDVWKDARALGKAAGDAAMQLCKNSDVSKVSGTAPFKTPGGNTVTSILLQPNPITKSGMPSGSTRATLQKRLKGTFVRCTHHAAPTPSSAHSAVQATPRAAASVED